MGELAFGSVGEAPADGHRLARVCTDEYKNYSSPLSTSNRHIGPFGPHMMGHITTGHGERRFCSR